MRDFLTTIRRQLPIGQKAALARFLEEVLSGRVAGDAQSVLAQLAQAGELLPMPADDPTLPAGYNAALRTLLANLSGLFQELDNLESVQDALADLNTHELDRLEVAVRDLASILSQTQRAHAENAQWSDVAFETFGADARRETDREWYQPQPALGASGQVTAFLPLAVDPEDRSLKLFPGGDFSRSVTAAGDPIAQFTVEELLGLSVDPNHPIARAADGRGDTYWREIILSEAPINVDPQSVPWLPEKYEGGAAARLHVRFPFALPFTEITLRPFSHFPLQILQVVWDNRTQPKEQLVSNGTFVSGTTYWTSGATATGTTLAFPSTSGWANSAGAYVTAVSGRTILSGATWTVAGSQVAYHLTGKVKRDRGITPRLLVNWFNAAGTLVRADWVDPTTEVGAWSPLSKLLIAPSGVAAGWQGTLVLVADGSGTVTWDDLSLSRTTDEKSFKQTAELESDATTVQLDGATGTDLWLVVAQPHYEFLQVALPEGELQASALWDQVRLAAEAEAETVLRPDSSLFQLEAGDKGEERFPLADDGSSLLREIEKWGGRIRNAAVELLRWVQPSPTTRFFNRYMYVMGAWEIEIRHREYAPQGLWVSLPYTPRGEVREIQLLTTPNLSELPDRCRFWLTARRSDRLDKAKLFTGGRATFASSTESPVRTADTHFTLTPVLRRDTFEGTDRNSRLALPFHPYVDGDRIWKIQAQLASGSLAIPTQYDPNRDLHFYTSGSTLTPVIGYRPLKVTLTFPNGTIARPDVMGKVTRGDIAFAGPEKLATATVEQSRTLAKSSAPFDFIRAADQARQGAQHTQTVPQVALKTRFKKLVAEGKGVALSLYWHKSADDTATSTLLTTGDVLMNPANYTVDTANGVITVRDGAPSGNTRYDSYVAYYYYQQDDGGSRTPQDARAVASRPTSGLDLGGTLNQALPVTRNVTDYVRGQVDQLQPAVLDDLDAEYYPVYEYLVDDRGRLVFANNLSPFGDTPASVLVEYESLEIEPRLIVEFAQAALKDFSTATPVLNDYTLLMLARR